MNTYVVTGSIGHISREIVKGLVNAGKEVRVITSSNDRVPEIENLGAKALVGQVQDQDFLVAAFKGAEAVYTMIPPIWNTDNWRKSQLGVAHAYVNAILANDIKYIVNLSSIGAHLGTGAGPIDGVHDFEQLLNKIPSLNVRHLRPVFFYYNFLNQIALVKQMGILGDNYGENEKLLLVHTNDIAAVALEELLPLQFSGNSVRYVVSDEKTAREVVDVLGKSIDKQIKWVEFTDEERLQGLLQAGIPDTHAKGYTELGKAFREGRIQSDIRQSMPDFGPTKLEDFAKEFAQAYLGSDVKVAV